VDLLRLGSGRRGTVARVLQGSTGDALNAERVPETGGAPATIAEAVA